MPITNKLLSGPTRQEASESEIVHALSQGAEAAEKGLAVSDCPPEFLPRKGKSKLYEAWLIGFKGHIAANYGK